MPQQQQPRRILEKSRTVRRRYQRSNKRFEFSASQIRRIEREEEREKKAKQLREREKKKLANKKKRAEKEAKEREDRRRLGIPEPNACKISASQPLLVNFFGAGRMKEKGLSVSREEDTEDSAVTQESEDSEEDKLIDAVDHEMKQQSLSPVQEEEEPDLMQKQEPQQLQETAVDQADNTTNRISEDFSDLETELGDDWLDDPELEKHMASIENTQQSLSSSAATCKQDQPTVQAPCATNDCAGMTESFEDDTSLMLQTLDPTILEQFETPRQPKTGLRELNKVPTSPPISIYAASNVRNGHAKYDSHRVTDTTQFKIVSPTINAYTPARQPPSETGIPQRPQIDHKQPLAIAAASSNAKNSGIHSASFEFKKPASAQPQRYLQPSVNRSTAMRTMHKVHLQPQFDAEDEFGDLPLSTQDVRDLDSMIGLG